MTEDPSAQPESSLIRPSNMDVPNFKGTIHYMMHLYEQALQEFVQFCTSLPGFSKIPIADQENIIKSKLTLLNTTLYR